MLAITACMRAMRPYHSVKNILLLIPLLVGHHYFNPVDLRHSLMGFLVFCLLASSTYLINDLVDLEKDKQHLIKQKRPFASGALPLKVGFLLAPSLTLTALAISCYLPLNFFLGAVLYYACSLLYSFLIKQKKWLDIVLLTGLYCLRVFSGMTLVENGYSLWLIIFVLFLFFSLALLKRYAELYSAKLANKTCVIGRAYQFKDSATLFFLGQVSAYCSILTFVAYIHSAKVLLLYKQPRLLWLICPCLFVWIKRLWHCATQGRIRDDPVEFTVMDPASWAMVVIVAAIGLLAV